MRTDHSSVRLNPLAALIFVFVMWPFVDPWTADVANDNGAW